MFTVNTTQSSNAQGATTVLAKCNGRQRTIKSDPQFSTEVNHAIAVGTLLNTITTPRQQAMLRHPSGGQRITFEHTSDAGGHQRWSINV